MARSLNPNAAPFDPSDPNPSKGQPLAPVEPKMCRLLAMNVNSARSKDRQGLIRDGIYDADPDLR